MLMRWLFKETKNFDGQSVEKSQRVDHVRHEVEVKAEKLVFQMDGRVKSV